MKWEENIEGTDDLHLDKGNGFVLKCPPMPNKIYRFAEGEDVGVEMAEVLDQFKSIYRLTIHAVDLKTCQVLTLLEDSCGADALNDLAIAGGPEIYGYESEMPTLFGLPFRGSPFFRGIPSSNDFDQIVLDGNANNPEIETLDWATYLELGQMFQHAPDDNDGRIELGPFPDLSSIRDRVSISNFLRALMKEKCLDLLGLDNKDATQPQDIMSFILEEGNEISANATEWAETEKILDAISSFASFEDQISTLRLVSKAFKASALRQVEGKLLGTDGTDRLPFACHQWGNAWFRAEARRGSSAGFASREDVIESVLWMASCRCRGICESPESCPGMQVAPTFRAGGQTNTLDLAQVRRHLSEQDFIDLSPFTNDQGNYVQSKFEKIQEQSLFQLCQSVYSDINDETYGETEPLRGLYGVAGADLPYKRFLRSLFLVFTNDACMQEGHFPEITVVMAESSIEAVGNETFIRMKKV